MQKLIETLSTVSVGQALTGGVTVVALVSVFIEITPVKINPVSKFLAWLGRKINSEVIAKVDRLETEVQAMRKADGEQEAINCRYRILRFGDEVNTAPGTVRNILSRSWPILTPTKSIARITRISRTTKPE